MANVQRILVTGAAGKVGQAFISRLLASGDEGLTGFTVRALCHNRVLQTGSRLEVVTGSIDQRATVERAADGASLSDDEGLLPFRGIHILGATRDSQLLLRLLRLPFQDLDDLLGDAVTESMQRSSPAYSMATLMRCSP